MSQNYENWKIENQDHATGVTDVPRMWVCDVVRMRLVKEILLNYKKGYFLLEFGGG